MYPYEFQDSNHKFEALLLLGQPSSEIRRRVAWQSHVNDPEGTDAVTSRVESEYGSKTFIISNLNITNVLQKHHILILYFHTAFLNIKTLCSHYTGTENEIWSAETYKHF